ncbi:MAG TPA: dihydroorotase [Cyclobacteriaceae bacterium]|nr:dihydroorotase [Cyclobacteriaceae bacterium]
MGPRILIKNCVIINEDKREEKDILIEPPYIRRIDRDISDPAAFVLEAGGNIVMPGIIDDQVHFREPGLTNKGDIYTESLAAVAGGVTSYMDMPNTKPQTLTQDLLEEKYRIAANRSWANYSFFMGVANNNLDEVFKTNPVNVCGIKVFLGASTGNMLVEDPEILEKLFAGSPTIIAAHCEHEPTIRNNTESAIKKYGENIPVKMHPVIRDDNACFLSSSFAVNLAKKHNAQLHILHLSTARELSLFSKSTGIGAKKITCEVCIHHLWFDDSDYAGKGNLIKWNPAIKTPADREGLFEALVDGRIDLIATDHAPHTLEEKNKSYLQAPSGGPLVQHSLPVMMEFHREGKISLEKIVEKMCHNPATLYCIDRRGFIREGNFADLAIVNLEKPWTVSKENILYKCGWSPFEGQRFNASVIHTIVSGRLVFSGGKFSGFNAGMRLEFAR